MPETSIDERRRSEQRQDAHNKATLLVLTFTLIAAGCAAGFTGWQAWIARDQEHRALRAYVVAQADLLTDRDGKNPYVKLTAENMGQTPVYDLIFLTWNSVLGQYEGISQSGRAFLTYDCSGQYAPALVKDQGNTFSKNYSREQGLGTTLTPLDNLDKVFIKFQRVVAYGTICYRDIFRQMHSIHLCYEWYSSNYGPERCPREIEGEQED